MVYGSQKELVVAKEKNRQAFFLNVTYKHIIFNDDNKIEFQMNFFFTSIIFYTTLL